MKDMPELKPCPFCGADAKMMAPNMHRKTNVSCAKGCVSTSYGTKEEVAKVWNNRTGEQVATTNA